LTGGVDKKDGKKKQKSVSGEEVEKEGGTLATKNKGGRRNGGENMVTASEDLVDQKKM